MATSLPNNLIGKTYYFAGSIRGGREDVELYKIIVQHLQACGPVLTEHVASDELTERGGSIEYANDEAGLAWLTRLFEHFRHRIWWNPEPERTWEYTRSTQMIAAALGPRMFPLTLDGVTRGIDALRR